MFNWIDENKLERPFQAGALAYILGRDCSYGPHFGLRSSNGYCRELFANGWFAAQQDYLENGDA